MRDFRVATGDPDQLLAIGAEHGETIEAIGVGDALEILAVEIAAPNRPGLAVGLVRRPLLAVLVHQAADALVADAEVELAVRTDEDAVALALHDDVAACRRQAVTLFRCEQTRPARSVPAWLRARDSRANARAASARERPPIPVSGSGEAASFTNSKAAAAPE